MSSTTAQQQSQSLVFRDCWFLFGGVNDIGYSHSLNLGRLDINHRMQEAHVNDTVTAFDSMAFPNVFSMPPAERARLLQRAVEDYDCHLIVSASAGLLGQDDEYAVARQYPHVSFIGTVLPPQDTTDSTTNPVPDNYIAYVLDWFSAAFVSGAVAAAVSPDGNEKDTCSGFITAFEGSVSTWSHTMGFVLGYRWGMTGIMIRGSGIGDNTTATTTSPGVVHVITMNNYHQPQGERLAAQQLVENKRCSVIARHTDPNDVDQYISELQRDPDWTGGPVLSMARYVDMSTFVGDTVFTSQVWDSVTLFWPLVENTYQRWRESTTVTTTTTNTNNDTRKMDAAFTVDRATAGQGTMQLSPFTPRVNQTLAREVEQQAWEYLRENANNNPLCGQRWRANGALLTPPDEPCLDVSTMDAPLSFLEFPADEVIYYEAPFEDGSRVCREGGGKFYQYDTDTLELSCLPCPLHTFREARVQAHADCVPCPPGTFTDTIASQQCTERTTNTSLLVGVSVTAVVVVLSTLLTAFIWHKKHRRRDNTFAPKQPHVQPVAIVFTDIQASTTIWANAPECMSQAVESHHALLRAIIQKHRGYEVKTVGDSFMIAHQSITSAVAIALEIQHKLHHFDWGTTKIDDIYRELTNQKRNNRALWNGLRIRVGIAYGLCDGQVDPITGGWDYYGTTVNTAARVEAVAHGGQIVVTGPAYHALLRRQCSLDTNPIPLPDSLQEIGIAVASTHGPIWLRGLSKRTPLVELSPLGFTERKFPQLRIEDGEPEYAEPGKSMEEGDVVGCMMDHPDLPHNEQDHLLSGLTPERRMEHMMKICMRDAGVRKYDATLLESSWNIFLSLKAMLSLHSPEEREKILSDWTKRWHLSVPVIHREILQTIGGDDIPKLLMLSARAATVVLAEKQPLLDAPSQSSSPHHHSVQRELPTSVSARTFLASTQPTSTRSFAPLFQQKHPSERTANDLEPTEEDNGEDSSFRSSSSF